MNILEMQNIVKNGYCSVAALEHKDADPDPSFQFDADPALSPISDYVLDEASELNKDLKVVWKG